MKKVKLGNTGEMVSHMSLGCMLMGSSIDKNDSYTLLDEYCKNGGSFLDTADCYAWWVNNGNGNESEKLLGGWMKDRGNRKDLFLATKVGAQPTDFKKAQTDFLGNIEGLSSKAIFEAVDRSLVNLKTDYVDLLYTHIDDRSIDLEETLGALNELIKSGKVKYIGCSNILPWRLERAKNICEKNGWSSYSCIQQSYTYLKPNPGSDFGVNEYVDKNLLDYVEFNKDISIVAYSPLLSGYYTREDRRESYWRKEFYESAANKERLKRLSKLAVEKGVTENSIILSWMLSKPVAAIPIIAASKIEHLKENINAGNLVLGKNEIDYLESV